MATIKNPLRVPHFLVLLFLTDCLRGTAAQRKRFVSRTAYRLARLLGLYQASYLAFRLRQKTLNFLRTLSGSTAQQRRFPLWTRAIAGLDNSDYLRSWIKRRYEGGPKIVVLALGSMGDVLQITPVLRVLREKFPAAEITLLHRSLAARVVLQGNPNVDSVAFADSHHFEEVKESVREEGAADLVVEIENISYILTYTPAPLTLRHGGLRTVFPESFFTTAAATQAVWKCHPPVYPRRESRFVWPEEWKDFQYLDVLGATGNLPIDRHSALDFFTEPGDAAAIDLFAPKKPYVTVQNGVDAVVINWSRATGQRPTKLLPTATWQETVRLLQAENLAVIQIGTKDDEPIEGVDSDLRGLTTLRQAAVILRHAVCHVGTEGGLVHLARAMDVRAVVAFGPTSTAFLGYPRNINLVATNCTGCWWTTKDWYIYCPRGLAQPSCMTAYTGDMIAAAVLSIFRTDGAEVR